MGSTLENFNANGPISSKQIGVATSAMQGMEMNPGKADVSKDANKVPGYPQDAFMEGPVMAMDEMFQKPETYGLRAGWSGFMGGMMTLVRVLPPDQYDHIVDLQKKQGEKNENTMPGMNMQK